MTANCTTLSGDREKERENIDANNKAKNTKRIRYKKVPPDGGWGWLVVLGTVTINLLISGFMKAFGVLFSELLVEFQSSTFAASYIPALSYFLHCSLGPVATYLTTKYSYRCVTLVGAICTCLGMILSVFATSIVHLYLTYGVLVGVGGSLTLPIGIYIVNAYFVRYKGLASGIAVSGSVIGSIIMPTLLTQLLDVYKVRGTMLIMGGIMLNTIVGALLYHPAKWHMKKVPIEENCIIPPKQDDANEKPVTNVAVAVDMENGTDPMKKKISDDKDDESRTKCPDTTTTATATTSTKEWRWYIIRAILKILNLLQNPLFVLLLLSNVVASISYANLLILLPIHTVGPNIDKMMASYLLSIVATFDFVGRVSGSTISDWLPNRKMYFYIGGILTAGLTLVLFPFANSYVSLCVFSAVFGLSTGTHIGAILVTMIEILGGEDNLKLSLSMLFFIKGVVHLIGMPICGFVYEHSQSHTIIVSALGFILVAIGIVWTIASRMLVDRTKKRNKLKKTTD